MIVNKDPNTFNFTIDIAASGTLDSASYYELSQADADITATAGVTIQGGTIGTDGSLTLGPITPLSHNSNTITNVTVSPYTAILIHSDLPQ